MQLKIYKDYTALSSEVASEILALVKQKPTAVICMASGDSPRRTCELLVAMAKEEKVDFSRCSFIGLDEWVGIGPQNPGSCHYFFTKNLFEPLQLQPSQIHLFDALAADLSQQCEKMDAMIAAKGGIDLVLVGVGMNGHIGFNEPGVPFENYSHVAELDATTQTVGQKYFTGATTLKQGITLGLHHLMDARKAILIANGVKKAPIIKRTLEEAISPALPASIMRQHAQGFIMVDEEAASLLDPQTQDPFCE